MTHRIGTISPGQQLQRLLAEIPGYEAADLISLLPLSAALQSAIYARILALQCQATLPDTDHLLNIKQIATHLGKSVKWVRNNSESFPIFQLGKEYKCSARWLDEWINEQGAAKMAAALPPDEEAV